MKLHVNQLFTYGLQINPSITASVQGDTTTKQICESVSYGAEFSSEAELHLNIGWGFVHINANKVWGPNVIWGTNGTLPQKCVPAGVSKGALQ